MTLLELLKLIRKHLKLTIILPIVCALATGAYAWILMPNEYTASVSMYVLSKSGSSDSITNSDLSASQMITNDIAQLIKSDRVELDAAKAVSLTNLEDYNISIENSTTTRMLTLSVTGTDPASVALVANSLAKTTDTVAQEVMDIQAVNALDEAAAPEKPSGPQRILYVAVAFLAGLFLAIAIIVVKDMVDTRVRTPEEIEELLGVPIIGRIPVMK